MVNRLEALREGLAIDKDQLDEELVRSPSTFYEVAEAHAYAISRRDQKKEKLKQEEGTLGTDIREQLTAKHGKCTVDMVDKALQTDPRYQELREDYLASCLECDRLEGLREAYRMRSHALRDLVQIHLSSHYVRDSEQSYEATRRIHAEARRKRTEERALKDPPEEPQRLPAKSKLRERIPMTTRADDDEDD